MSNHFSVNKYIFCAAIVAGVFFVLMMTFFFWKLDTTTSSYSMNGVTAPHQFFYNFMNGRMFQTSLFATDLTGASVGFSHNPYAYLHLFAIHVHLTPFVFATIWNLWPNLTWLYGIMFFINYGAIALFTWMTLRHLSPQSFKIKALLAIALLMASGFLFTFQQNAQLLMFSGPFALAAFYFLITRSRARFLLSLILMCLVSEDAAMVSLTFCVYIYLFEKDSRSYAIQGGVFSIVYIALVMLVIQPAARSELMLIDSTTLMAVMKHVLNFNLSAMGAILIGFFPVLFFLPAFLIVYLLFGMPKVELVRILGIILIPPLPHWGECVIVGASHHLMPVLIFTFVGLVIMLGSTKDIQSNDIILSRVRVTALFFLLTLFMMGSFRVMISNLPEQILLPLYKASGRLHKVQQLEEGMLEQESNRKLISTVKMLPRNSSLVYLTNSGVEGFIAGRSDIWRFPANYDLADYLVIQPNARQSFYSATIKGDQSLAEILSSGRQVDFDDANITVELAKAITRDLVVERKTHRVVVNEWGLILLERIESHRIYNPSTTMNFGFLSNIFRARNVEKN